jgi:hypothetical protein
MDGKIRTQPADPILPEGGIENSPRRRPWVPFVPAFLFYNLFMPHPNHFAAIALALSSAAAASAAAASAA